MSTQNFETTFPKTREDLSNLKKTAVDAARDVSDTASEHADKAKGQLKNLASHAQEESCDELDKVKVTLTDVGTQVREYVAAHPLACIGTAVAVGFWFGFSRRAVRG